MPHGRGSVEMLVNADKANAAALQFLGDGHEIYDVAADSVQPVHHDLLKPLFLCVLHHTQELWTLGVFATEALVFIDQKLVFFTGFVGVDVAFAHFDLIADTLAFICRFAFAAINGEFHTSTSEVIVTLRSGAGNKTDFFCLYSSNVASRFHPGGAQNFRSPFSGMTGFGIENSFRPFSEKKRCL